MASLMAASMDAQTSRSPARQYFAKRSVTPAAAAQFAAVLRGQMRRACRAIFRVNSCSLEGTVVPRNSTDGTIDGADTPPDMTRPHATHQKCFGRTAAYGSRPRSRPRRGDDRADRHRPGRSGTPHMEGGVSRRGPFNAQPRRRSRNFPFHVKHWGAARALRCPRANRCHSASGRRIPA